MTRRSPEITPEILVRAYRIGLFPMAESADSPTLFWVDPEARGVFPLDGLIISKSLAKTIRSDRYEVFADRDFDAVIKACAMRDKTWINSEILRLYGDLHRSGRAHSIEAYDSEGLAGGLYGVSIGGAFFGESMFHRRPDASKVALAHLVARLRAGGFGLLDAQFVTPHLASLGAIEVPRKHYKGLLEAALELDANFSALPIERPLTGAEALRLALG